MTTSHDATADQPYEITADEPDETWIKVPIELFQAGIPPTSMIVYGLLRWNQGYRTPSLQQLADQARLSKATACRALNDLEGKRLITRHRTPGSPTRIHCNTSLTKPGAWARKARQEAQLSHPETPQLSQIETPTLSQIETGPVSKRDSSTLYKEKDQQRRKSLSVCTTPSTHAQEASPPPETDRPTDGPPDPIPKDETTEAQEVMTILGAGRGMARQALIARAIAQHPTRDPVAVALHYAGNQEERTSRGLQTLRDPVKGWATAMQYADADGAFPRATPEPAGPLETAPPPTPAHHQDPTFQALTDEIASRIGERTMQAQFGNWTGEVQQQGLMLWFETPFEADWAKQMNAPLIAEALQATGWTGDTYLGTLEVPPSWPPTASPPSSTPTAVGTSRTAGAPKPSGRPVTASSAAPARSHSPSAAPISPP